MSSLNKSETVIVTDHSDIVLPKGYPQSQILEITAMVGEVSSLGQPEDEPTKTGTVESK